MALTSLLDLELTVPDPAELEAFWERRGMRSTATGTLGTDDRASQLRLREGGYRHVSEVRMTCASVVDLDDMAERLERLGVSVSRGDVSLRCADPVLDHGVVIEVAEATSARRPYVRSTGPANSCAPTVDHQPPSGRARHRAGSAMSSSGLPTSAPASPSTETVWA